MENPSTSGYYRPPPSRRPPLTRHLSVGRRRRPGASVPPPYVDKFGEMDQGLNRGNPLTLWREQYDKLNRLWIAHGIPEEVTRLMEDSFSQTDWQNL